MTTTALANDQKESDFDGLWCFIWGRLELSDSDSQAMARRLNDQGVYTWDQWERQDFPIA
jgi:hypothetical protein